MKQYIRFRTRCRRDGEIGRYKRRMVTSNEVISSHFPNSTKGASHTQLQRG